MKIVIIGGGTSGIAVATHLRRMNEKAKIVILEKNNGFAHIRSMLPYLLFGDIVSSNDIIAASVEQMQRIFNIKVKTNHEVYKIDHKNKKVFIKGKPTETYDKLVIATGSLQARPNIDGVLSEGIFDFKSVNDVNNIKKYLSDNPVQNIVIIGSNKLALKLALGFAKQNFSVSVITKEDFVLPMFDNDIISELDDFIAKMSITIYTASEICSFANNQITLKNNISVDYDLAIFAPEQTPNSVLAANSELKIGKHNGVITNEYMQTDNDDIYACGSVVEAKDKITGKNCIPINSSYATKQAKVVADHICNIAKPINAFIDCEIINLQNIIIGRCGANEKDLQKNNIPYHKIFLRHYDKSLCFADTKQNVFKLLFSAQGKILGLQICGEHGISERINAVWVQIMHNGDIYDLINEIIAFDDPLNMPKDPLNTLGSLAKEIVEGRLKTISISELKENMFLMDTRSQHNFEHDHLPNAVNLPLNAIRDNLHSIPKDKKIVLYCNRGYGAYLAYRILSQNGFNNLFLLFF